MHLSKNNSGYTFSYQIFPQGICTHTFEENKQVLLEILSSSSAMKLFLKSIKQKMEEASEACSFEIACLYRDFYRAMQYINEVNIKKQKITSSTILVGEKIKMDYKLFYIVNGKILFKKKYSTLQIEDLQAFLLQAKQANLNDSKVKDEKRELDFQDILYSELQDPAAKEILYLKKGTNLTHFLDRLGAL